MRPAESRRVLSFFFSLAVGLLLQAAHAEPAVFASGYENRVMLDEDLQWATSKLATDKILERIKRAGFNVYVPCVWHGRGTHYPSPIAPIDRFLTGRIVKGEDPLEYLVKKAHELGIQVHPWFTVVRREAGMYPRWRSEGTREEAFNVHDREFREFIVKLMLDVVKRYPVDGINLDYIRSMGICQSKSCKDDYAMRSGRNLDEDLLLGNLPLHPGAAAIEKWNADAVTSIVRDVAIAAKAIRPTLIISVDAHPLNSGLKQREGQDSIEWANRGWVDVIFNMDYAKEVNLDVMNRARSALKDPRRVVLLSSFFDFSGDTVVPRSPDKVAEHVALSRRLWPDSGIAFYHFKQLTDGQLDVLRAGPFTQDSPPQWLGAAN